MTVIKILYIRMKNLVVWIINKVSADQGREFDGRSFQVWVRRMEILMAEVFKYIQEMLVKIENLVVDIMEEYFKIENVGGGDAYAYPKPDLVSLCQLNKELDEIKKLKVAFQEEYVEVLTSYADYSDSSSLEELSPSDSKLLHKENNDCESVAIADGKIG